jgi:hypothetical protein
MKTLKWLWLAALLTIGFKMYNILSAGPNASDPSDMESFVGMIFAFALISAALIVLWIIGRTKEGFSRRAARKNP